MTTIGAVEQSDRRIMVTVTGLDAEVPAVDVLTLWRDDLDTDRTPVRGYFERAYDATLDSFVAVDHEGPLARPYWYVLELVKTDGTRVEYAAGPVTIAGEYPTLSNPLTGDAVEVTLERWDDVTREGRSGAVQVVDRPDPVVIVGPLSTPVSGPQLRTDNRSTRRELVRILSTGYPVLLRVPEVDVDDAYLVVTGHTEARLTNRPTDVRRRHVLTGVHVGAPELHVAASADDLQDLADAFPAPLTLTDVSVTFSTLLELAAADLGAL